MPKHIAAVITEWFPRSHADVIVGKFLEGFPIDEGVRDPRVRVASMYVDQFGELDRSRSFAARHDILITRSIRQALMLGGGDIAVDGVLLIGEHGDYPLNEKGQQLYPRRCFFEQIAAVMATTKRSVPVFCDKHLSYNWHDSLWMAERARALGIPFMAGSSLPFAWRRPWLELEKGEPIREALAVGYAGLDIYGFHALETLQCMAERRRGGETGVAAVTCLEGDDVWNAEKAGDWWRDLADAAVETIEKRPHGRPADHCKNPALFQVEYRDGFRGAVLMLTGYVQDFAFACRDDRGIRATEFYLQPGAPHAHFSYLSLNVEEMLVTGQPSYPVERTLLTSGVLEAALDSRHQGHVRLETPHLDVRYESYDALPWRPTSPRPLVPLRSE